jgi:hypothetical protein
VADTRDKIQTNSRFCFSAINFQSSLHAATYNFEALQVVRYTYIWLKRKIHYIYNELYNASLSTVQRSY